MCDRTWACWKCKETGLGKEKCRDVRMAHAKGKDAVSGRFADESFCQRLIRQRLRLIRQRPKLLHQRPTGQFANV